MSKKQRGFTMSELTVTVAISSIIGLILFSLFTLASNQYNSLRGKAAAEELAARIEYTFRSIFSQAIDVRYGAPDTVISTAYPALTDRGQIASVTVVNANTATLLFDTLAKAPAAWYSLAAFLRESGLARAAGAERGTARKTAVFYKPPSAVLRTSGVLFVDYGPAPGAGGALVPGYDDDYFDRVVLFEMTKHKHASRDVVVSVDFRFALRYYRNSDGRALSWCPNLDTVFGGAGVCGTTSAWTDLEKQFSVTLRNNLLRSATDPDLSAAPGAFEERVLGAMYFFFPNTPVDVR